MRFIVLVLLLSLSVFAGATDISMEDIRAWANNSNTGKSFEFYTPEQIREIGLTNKEKAYLAPVSLKNAGRNNMFQTCVIIPSKQKVILLTDTVVNQVDNVLDVDNDRVSEIIVKNSGSGGGSEKGERAIVQIDPEGKPIVLRKVLFENNAGEWGKEVSGYYQSDVTWQFTDSNLGDDIKDLIETVTVEKGRNGKPPVTKKTIKRYHFINSYFVKYGEELSL